MLKKLVPAALGALLLASPVIAVTAAPAQQPAAKTATAHHKAVKHKMAAHHAMKKHHVMKKHWKAKKKKAAKKA